MSTTLTFPTVPAQGSLLLKAVFSRKGKWKDGMSMPRIEAVVEAVAPDAARLDAYRKVCGFQGDDVPVTFPHVLASPLHLAILTCPAFPLPAMGLIHVRNRIVQHRAIRAEETLRVHIKVEGHRDVRSGVEFDFVSTVSAGGETIWESVTTLLHRRPVKKDGARPPKEAVVEAEAARTEEWKLPPDQGRRYARVSGDWNPIHLWPMTAKLFGFPRPIAHGMWTLARSAAALSPEAPAFPSCLDVDFKRPVLLPGTVNLQAGPEGEGRFFRLKDRKGEKTFLEGKWVAM